MSETIHERARRLRRNQTPAEVYFWNRVRKRKILGSLFLRQYVLEYPDRLNKSNYFIVDFYCSQKKLIVEIDGKIHQQQVEYDEFRETILKEMKYSIIRFTNYEVLNNWHSVEKQMKDRITMLDSRY